MSNNRTGAARRRRARRHPGLTAVAGFTAAAAVIIVLQHLALLIVVAVAAIAGYCVLTRNRRAGTRTAARRGQAPAPRLDVNEANAAPGAPAAAGARQGTTRLNTRARRNGWLPPTSPELVTVALSPQCRDLDCVSCPGGPCECPACRHSPDRVVAVSNALYDAAQAEPVPPF